MVDFSTNIVKELIAGASAGILGTVLGFPLDTLKTRMQTNPTKYNSIVNSFHTIKIEEGVINGLYRGIAPPLTALTILNMMNFTVYSQLIQKFNIQNFDKHKTIEPLIFVSGSLAGISAAMVSTPFELVKIQMQMSNTFNMNKVQLGTIDTTSLIIRKYGISDGLYRGHFINTLREMLFLGSYFFFYEHFKVLLNSTFHKSVSIPLAGGISGAFGWIVSFPLDSVKANIQGSPLNSTSQSSLKVSKEIFMKKGIIGLYSGLGASVARAFLVSSSRFSAYEITNWLIKDI